MEFEQVLDLIRAFLVLWPKAEWGPAHIVLSDWNLSDSQIGWAIARLMDAEDQPRLTPDVIDAIDMHVATRRFLSLLLCIPESVREPGDD